MNNNNQPITPPQFYPNNPAPTLPKKSKKPLIWVALIVIVLAVVCTGWFVWKSQVIVDDKDLKQIVVSQENWKTYINSRVGYQFEYPSSNLSLELNETIKYPDSQTKNQDLIQFAANSNDVSEQQPISYGARTYVGVKNNSIENWIQSGGSSTNTDLSNYIKRSIGGQVAYTARSIAITYTMYDNNVYVIEAHSGIEPARDTDLVYSHILSTFKFTNNADNIVVKVYFRDSNTKTDSCGVLVPITRIIPKTEAVATAAITELLKGPTAMEKSSGYKTDIPSVAKLNFLTIINGEARADFSSSTESGGSCNLTTDQITKTLLQFPTIKTVKLSVDGKTENIFQP